MVEAVKNIQESSEYIKATSEKGVHSQRILVGRHTTTVRPAEF